MSCARAEGHAKERPTAAGLAASDGRTPAVAGSRPLRAQQRPKADCGGLADPLLGGGIEDLAAALSVVACRAVLGISARWM
jgi:hypothetical protein